MENTKDEKRENVFKKFHPVLLHHTFKHAHKILKLFKKSDDNKNIDYLDILSEPPDSYEGKLLGDKIEKIWYDELKSRKNPSLFRVLLKTTAYEYCLALFLNLIVRVVCIITIFDQLRKILIIIDNLTLGDLLNNTSDLYNKAHNSVTNSSSPFLDDKITSNSLQHSRDIASNPLYMELLINVLIMFIVQGIYLVLFSYSKLERVARGVKSRVALSQLIFRKSQRLKLETSIKQSSSVAIDLISNEVTMLEEANHYVVSVIYAPIILVTGTLWLGLSISGLLPIFATYVAMLIPMAIELYTPLLYKRFTTRRSIETKHRVEVTGTFLNSVKVAKMYNWEDVFRQLIDSLRAREMEWYKKLDFLLVFETLTISFLMRLLPTVMYIIHIWIYGELSATVLIVGSTSMQNFTSEGLFGIIRGSKCFVDIRTACKKIQAYMMLPEKKDMFDADESKQEKLEKTPQPLDIYCNKVVLAYDSGQSSLGEKKKNEEQTKKKNKNLQIYSITIGDKKSMSQSNSNNIIENLNVHMKHNELVIVIGPVGSGKTTLLLSFLGELKATSGKICIPNGMKCAYASQEPWILSDTIKNNILLGRKFNPERYRQVIEACSLVRDLSLMPNGEETFVGSKGVSLSGGQKARVNLARAVYGEADVYLLDDPLSAVDSRVSKHMFNECFVKFLADKLIILATHQRQYINQADQVIALERGSAPIVGSHLEILKSCQFMLKNLEEHQKELDKTRTPSPEMTFDELISGDPALEGTENVISGINPVDRLKDMVGANGNVVESSYSVLLKYGFTKLSITTLIVTFLIYSPLNGFVDYYMRIWRNRIIDDSMNPNLTQAQFIFNLFMGCILYLIVSALGCSLLSVFELQILYGLRKAANNLHKKLLDSLFSAKMSFYDFCPPGQLGARYTADFTQIDHVLKPMMLNVAQMCCWVSGFCVVLALMQPICAILYLLLLLVFGPKFLKNYKSLMTLANINKQLRAPLYTQIGPVVDELNTLRSDSAYLEYVDKKFQISQNKLTTVSLLTILYETRLTSILKIPTLLVTICAYYVIFVYDRDTLETAKSGVFVMMITSINFFFPILIEMYSTADASMRSVDSVRQLFDLEPEIDEQKKLEEEKKTLSPSLQPTPTPKKITPNFKQGKIEFKNVSLRYFKDEKAILSDLSFVIEEGEKVGVVGRSGAGKSSIVSVLFRLYPFEGSVEIDGICTKKLTLAQLRSSLGVIPQDPVLFSDSLRKNLDPFGSYKDEQLWKALEVVELKQHVASNLLEGLDYQISEGGRNFSVGQRQLVCLARAILKKSKILVLDEATANVDQDTDLLIQKTIMEHFSSSTVITIAHRLNTILDYDKILVLDAGQIVEYDTVDRLRNKENGFFKAMIASSATTKSVA